MEVLKINNMNKLHLLSFALVLLSLNVLPIAAQVHEPEYIGESFLLMEDSLTISFDKEIADFTSGVVWSSWNAHSIEIRNSTAETRFSSNEPLKIVVRAGDNNSDPLTIISIYKFKVKTNKRTVILSEDNSGTFKKSKTNSKDIVRFNGNKFGNSSYIIELKNLKAGEYGIIVSNPNSRDSKRTVVSCFGID